MNKETNNTPVTKKRAHTRTGKFSKKRNTTTEAINYANLSKAINAFGLLSPIEQNLVVAITKLVN